MSELSVPALQTYVGGMIQINDHERKYVIGGQVTKIELSGADINVFYQSVDDDGDPHTNHYGIDLPHFHNGGPAGVFVSDTYHVTLTFTPP